MGREVRELTLAPPPEPVSFMAGQWLSLQLPVGERPPLVRAYSLAAPPSPSGELVLCLDRVSDGLGSGYLFERRPGDPITFGGPLGNFVLPEEPGDLLWIARYTGIVPFRAMLLEQERLSETRSVTLIYSAAHPDELAYREELEDAARRLPWFEMILTVDHPAPGWAGRTEPALELAEALVRERANVVPMICGVRAFVRPLRDLFYGLGYDRKRVKWENYD